MQIFKIHNSINLDYKSKFAQDSENIYQVQQNILSFEKIQRVFNNMTIRYRPYFTTKAVLGELQTNKSFTDNTILPSDVCCSSIKKFEYIDVLTYSFTNRTIINKMDLDSEISKINNEMNILKNKLTELENKKRQEKEYNEKNDIDINLDIIQSGINRKFDGFHVTSTTIVIPHHGTYGINSIRYDKSLIKFYHQEIIPQLQAIHNVLFTLSERINSLEGK